jgi:hypothetical protein
MTILRRIYDSGTLLALGAIGLLCGDVSTAKAQSGVKTAIPQAPKANAAPVAKSGGVQITVIGSDFGKFRVEKKAAPKK